MARVRFNGHPGVAPARVGRSDIPERGAGSAWRRLRRNAAGAARCRRGIYALEFAMLVPVFIPILMGCVEVAWQFGASVALDHASLEASRFASLGRKNADGSRAGSTCETAVKDAAIKAGGGFLRADRLTLLPMQYASASGMRGRSGGTAGTGVGGSFVEFRLEYRQRFIVSGKLFGKTEMTHVATTTVMNEPYPDASNPPPCQT